MGVIRIGSCLLRHSPIHPSERGGYNLMFREFLSSRLIQGGIVFCVLCVGGSLLYSWHVDRATEKAMTRHDRFLQAREKHNETRPAETVKAPTDTETPGLVNTPLETTDTPMPDETEAKTIDATEFAALEDALLPDEMSSEAEVHADFPEVPKEFPLTPVWDDDRFPNYQKGDMPDHETISRVLIKLWNQGDHGFVNGYLSYTNGRVYPLYPDTLYVTWKEEIVGGPDTPRTIRVPGTIVGTHDRHFTPEELYFFGVEASYPDINFVDKHTAGIDPETFLTDAEK